MWFTRVSIGNPVLATMVMLAFVVLGLFSYQRLAVDQFPNIDFPTVVVVMDYPGASPEIVEAEVTKKIEEAVNTVAGINSLYSRSYEGTSVVIVEFNLDVDGRKAADDVREKVSLIRPLLRDEVKEPRISRFDPQSVPIFNVAVLSEDGKRGTQELTTWATQVLQKKLENVRGVGSVGGGRRPGAADQHLPQAGGDGGARHRRRPGGRRGAQREPGAAARLDPLEEQERVVQINARVKRPEDFRDIVVARKSFGGRRRHCRRASSPAAPDRRPRRSGSGRSPTSSTARRRCRAWRSTTASARCCSRCRSRRARTRSRSSTASSRRSRRAKPLMPPGVKVEVNRDNSRSIRVSVANVKRTLFEGAALTILIVFLFLNSWRSTVITGLTLPIALIGTFLFMYMFGFTINTITMMALSLCVGLLIDDAIVVRENIVRHVQMGKSAHDAALSGTNEIGLAVLATTLSIVAVFLPIGFMGGIVGKFFHEFGLTIVAAVLISMFVSFTLDPMLSSVWHDPQAERGHGAFGADGRRTLYDRTIGRVTGLFDRLTLRLSAWLPGDPRLVAAAPAGHARHRPGDLRRQLLHHPDPRRRVRAEGRLLRDPGQLLHAGRLLARGDRDAGAAGRRGAARDARGALHRDDDQQRPGRRQDLRRDLRAPGRPQGPRSAASPRWRCRCASGWRASRASPSPTSARPTSAAARACSSRSRAPTSASWSGCRRRSPRSCSRSPAWSTSTRP